MLRVSLMADEIVTGWRQEVERQLHVYLDCSKDCPGRLHAAMEYSLLAGGKRLRPLLVLMACDACGGDISAAMPAACAIEMVHTYSLIHDDLPAMDDDTLRRGRPTCHIQFDEATAILAGDALLTLAFEILATHVQPPHVAAGCCADLASAAGMCGMVGGQIADLESEARPGWSSTPGRSYAEPCRNQPAANCSTEESLALLESIHRRKTGRLLCCALTLGGRIAGANPQTLQCLKEYGELVGLAFQIADDLLDVGGDPQTMGKGARKDAKCGKLTYPGLLGVSESETRARHLADLACQSIQSLGERGHRLESIAHFIIQRDR